MKTKFAPKFDNTVTDESGRYLPQAVRFRLRKLEGQELEFRRQADLAFLDRRYALHLELLEAAQYVRISRCRLASGSRTV